MTHVGGRHYAATDRRLALFYLSTPRGFSGSQICISFGETSDRPGVLRGLWVSLISSVERAFLGIEWLVVDMPLHM